MWTRRHLLVLVAGLAGCSSRIEPDESEPSLGGVRGFSGLEEPRKLQISVSMENETKYDSEHVIGPDEEFVLANEEWMFEPAPFEIRAEPIDEVNNVDPVQISVDEPLSESNCVEVYVFYTPSGMLDVVSKPADDDRNYHCL